ncbi:MAG: rubredoxin [bacterium]
MYECLSCGYVYQPADGVPAAGVSPGTSFHDLPSGFFCPACGSGRDRFVRLRAAHIAPGGDRDGR